MYDLDQKYLEQLEILAEEIQESEELQNYLEEEEEEYFLQLRELFEPRIAQVFDEVAANDPLQLISLETILLNEAFEGLYLPKILGHSVLRGELNEQYKYIRPQEHFRDILLAICNSANFDILRKRIGQSIQMGFALSSDIWVTNLINGITNKRVRYFLQSQKLDRYLHLEDRIEGYNRYRRQFVNDNFQTAEFPTTLTELQVLFSPLKSFLIYRINLGLDNNSIVTPLKELVHRKEFQGTTEHLQILVLFAGWFDLEEDLRKDLAKVFNKVRKDMPEFEEHYFDFLLELFQRDDIDLGPQVDQHLSAIVDKKIKDNLSKYYQLMDVIHSKGYVTEEAQEAIRVFCFQYEGLSTINECVRRTICGYFTRFISNLEEDAYADFFEISKLFPVYIDIFANQQFNQDLKDLSMAYVRRLLKRFTDKRGKDYQDIKKFVSTTFQDLGFLKEKEVVELFKTRRKKRPTTA